MKVRLEDVHALGYCMKSVRPWFRRHDLDFMDFVKNGIEADVLLATDDELARRAIAKAKEREAHDGR